VVKLLITGQENKTATTKYEWCIKILLLMLWHPQY